MPDLPPLIEALLQPQRYPGAVERVELVQTHISWLLLAGDFAYKIKKPLKLPFLDFSGLALRLACCLDELRLNRRLAPDIYLEVLGIFNTPQDPQWQGTGEPIEFAVKMRRFDESGRLDLMCARGLLQPRHLSELADTLVAFHASAAVAPSASRFGSLQQILEPALENVRDLLQWLPDVEVKARLQTLQAWLLAQFKLIKPLVEARKQAGRVRECHGDLHLANLVLIDQHVRMFDCLEFNEDLRWIDVASDIAFTYIDLLEHRQPGLANWFVNEVWSRSGDYEAARVLRFYAVYRALVRAKVAALRPGQTAGPGSEALAYMGLAEQLTAPRATRLIITHGLSGCGKTQASTALLQNDLQAPTLRLRSDVERRRLFDLPGHAAGSHGVNAGLYSPLARNSTYTFLREQAALLLRSGWSVIVDAAFLQRSQRDRFRALAAELGAEFGILAPLATPEQLRQRIEARCAAGQDASEATLAVLAQQMREIETLQVDELVLANKSLTC